jgi:hypothetical protein
MANRWPSHREPPSDSRRRGPSAKPDFQSLVSIRSGPALRQSSDPHAFSLSRFVMGLSGPFLPHLPASVGSEARAGVEDVCARSVLMIRSTVVVAGLVLATQVLMRRIVDSCASSTRHTGQDASRSDQYDGSPLYTGVPTAVRVWRALTSLAPTRTRSASAAIRESEAVLSVVEYPYVRSP